MSDYDVNNDPLVNMPADLKSPTTLADRVERTVGGIIGYGSVIGMLPAGIIAGDYVFNKTNNFLGDNYDLSEYVNYFISGGTALVSGSITTCGILVVGLSISVLAGGAAGKMTKRHVKD